MSDCTYVWLCEIVLSSCNLCLFVFSLLLAIGLTLESGRRTWDWMYRQIRHSSSTSWNVNFATVFHRCRCHCSCRRHCRSLSLSSLLFSLSLQLSSSLSCRCCLYRCRRFRCRCHFFWHRHCRSITPLPFALLPHPNLDIPATFEWRRLKTGIYPAFVRHLSLTGIDSMDLTSFPWFPKDIPSFTRDRQFRVYKALCLPHGVWSMVYEALCLIHGVWSMVLAL